MYRFCFYDCNSGNNAFFNTNGKSYLYEAPTYAILPGIALTLTILSLDTLGRALAAVLEDRHELGAALAPGSGKP